MDIIGQGDFAVTHSTGQTKFSFRMPSQADIHFVKEGRLARLTRRASPPQITRERNRRKRKKKKN